MERITGLGQDIRRSLAAKAIALVGMNIILGEWKGYGSM